MGHIWSRNCMEKGIFATDMWSGRWEKLNTKDAMQRLMRNAIIDEGEYTHTWTQKRQTRPTGLGEKDI